MARFDDGKDAGALRTIGEVSVALGIRPHVLRYWEEQFPMLRPLKRAGGRRLYRAEDVALIETIDRLVNREGYTLKGARAALGGRGLEAPAAAQGVRAASKPQAASDVLARLKAIRDELRQALAAA
jgi:DNA-binding transcriptional MerR regulator